MSFLKKEWERSHGVALGMTWDEAVAAQNKGQVNGRFPNQELQRLVNDVSSGDGRSTTTSAPHSALANSDADGTGKQSNPKDVLRETPGILSSNSARRKQMPMARGFLDYFTAAMAAVAEVSFHGNQKHNPGEEMHHARGKSNDHADCIIRHLGERGTFDEQEYPGGPRLRHSAKMAWRAFALLQQELEDAGEASMPRGARITQDTPR
jgi:hypothetical protein